MDLNALSVAFRAFEASLLDLGTLNLPLISRLESATLRLKARTTASKLITEAYVMLYNAVMDPKVLNMRFMAYLCSCTYSCLFLLERLRTPRKLGSVQA
jgi:hypothetical protein